MNEQRGKEPPPFSVGRIGPEVRSPPYLRVAGRDQPFCPGKHGGNEYQSVDCDQRDSDGDFRRLQRQPRRELRIGFYLRAELLGSPFRENCDELVSGRLLGKPQANALILFRVYVISEADQPPLGFHIGDLLARELSVFLDKYSHIT